MYQASYGSSLVVKVLYIPTSLVGVQQLYCGQRIQVDVLGLVHISKATRAQFADEPVVTKLLSYAIHHIGLSFG
jgi:hypothetical protein